MILCVLYCIIISTINIKEVFLMKKKTLIVSILFVFCLLFSSVPIMAETFSNGSSIPVSLPYSTRAPITLKKGKTVTAYILKDEKAKFKVSGDSYKWSSSNKKYATVSNGIVMAKSKGTAIITATKGKVVYKCKLVVETPKFSQYKSTITVGKNYQFKMTGTKQRIQWSSSDKSIASVSSNGTVYGKSSGTAKITAKISSKKYTRNITITPSKPGQPTTNTFNLGQTWTVPGQWNLTINSVTETFNRNPYSDLHPGAVYIIDYTYENLGYTNDYMNGLYLNPELGRIVDSNGVMGYSYPGEITYYPQEVPIGAKCNAQCCIGVQTRGSFKIYFDEYDKNYTKHSAVFNCTAK